MTIAVGFQACAVNLGKGAKYNHAGRMGEVIGPRCFQPSPFGPCPQAHGAAARGPALPLICCRPPHRPISWFACIPSGTMRLATGGCDETVRVQRTIEVL